MAQPLNPPGGNPSLPTGAHRLAGSEAWADLLKTQRQLGQATQEARDLRERMARRTHQMQLLQRVSEILAATSKDGQVASVILEVLAQEYGCPRGAAWTLEDGGAEFAPREGFGLDRAAWASMRLPAPNPFPDQPLLLFQGQWLDRGNLPQPLIKLASLPDSGLYFVPFEYQLLLLGFAVLEIPKDRALESEDLDSIAILQRQTAVTLYNAWLFRDLKDQRNTLQSQAVELERVNIALREADRLKSEFLALTSHELRTPLTGILGFTRLVLDGLYTDEEDMKQMLQDSYASGQHLLNLLNDILDLAKIESGRLEVQCSPCPLQAVVDEVRPVAEAYPRRPGVALAWPSNLADMPEVLADAGRLKQVLLNLISNALKFTKEGSVTLQAERGIGLVVIRVVDTGIGVSAEAQSRLFQKFVQAEGGHAREYGGTGLGLVICKHLVEMMGGTIGLYSEGQGKGTTMTITVPIA
ncbi:MAG: HAMP domain-containing histidine kinase [Acidobacteria bacterium]|nr:HAMP domain-containing histidine kinase [Acidobacteriota bacterium]